MSTEAGSVLGTLNFISYLIEKLYSRHRKLEDIYEIAGKKSSELKPEEVIVGRDFKWDYYQRSEDKEISNLIKEGKNVLIVDPSLSGKSTAIFYALKTIDPPCQVIIPRCKDINIETFVKPRLYRRRRRVLVLDDLQVPRDVEPKIPDRNLQ